MIAICKSYKFCYGHRVWNQTLSGNKECRCIRMHGHSCKLDITFASDKLDNGMVVDFNELKMIKTFIDDHVDHRFLVDIEDPLFKSWLLKYGLGLADLIAGEAGFVFKSVGLKKYDNEFFDSLVILPFVPTAENLAIWMFSIVEVLIEKMNKKLEKKVRTVKLRWWESDTSFAEVNKT